MKLTNWKQLIFFPFPLKRMGHTSDLQPRRKP